MKRQLRFAAMLAATVAGQASSAQLVEQPPTDVDLSAFYCIGVVQRQIRFSDEMVAKVAGADAVAGPIRDRCAKLDFLPF